MKITKVCSTTGNPACDEWSTLWFFFSRQISFLFSRGGCQSIERPIWARSITHPAAGFVPTPPFRYPSQTSIFIIPIPPDQASVILEPNSACKMHLYRCFRFDLGKRSSVLWEGDQRKELLLLAFCFTLFSITNRVYTLNSGQPRSLDPSFAFLDDDPQGWWLERVWSQAYHDDVMVYFLDKLLPRVWAFSKSTVIFHAFLD